MRLSLAEQARQANMDHYGFGPRAMMKLKICKACGCTSPSTLNFCTECCAKLPEKNMFQEYKERHKFCKSCDTVVKDDAEYCPQCGKKL